MSERSSRSGAADGVESIGAYLAGQRRIRGISPQQLAEITRIPLRSIQRLEEGRFDADLDGFARGFVRTVAEALGLDPHETLTRMLREPSGGDSTSAEDWQRRGRVLTLLVLALILVGVGTLAREGLRFVGKPEAVQPDYVYRRDPVRDLAVAQGPYLPSVAAPEVPPSAEQGGAEPASPDQDAAANLVAAPTP